MLITEPSQSKNHDLARDLKKNKRVHGRCKARLHHHNNLVVFSRDISRALENSFRYCSWFSWPYAVHTKISKEEIAVATELARAADVAGRTIQKRRLRQVLMERCAENVEELCRGSKQSEGGLRPKKSDRVIE